MNDNLPAQITEYLHRLDACVPGIAERITHVEAALKSEAS